MSVDETTTRRTGRALTWLAALALLALLWRVFDGWIAQRDHPNADLAVADGAREWVLKRNRAGHYVAPGEINGQPVWFLLDTGATLVSVPDHLGPALGLARGVPGVSLTANGDVTVYAARIRSLRLGPFHVQDVAAALNPGMRDDVILLGMSVLKNLEFTQRGDTLVLRAYR